MFGKKVKVEFTGGECHRLGPQRHLSPRRIDDEFNPDRWARGEHQLMVPHTAKNGFDSRHQLTGENGLVT